MKNNSVAIICLVIALIAFGVYAYYEQKSHEEINNRIEQIKFSNKQVINIDSIQTLVEKKVLDSIRVIKVSLEQERARTKALSNQIRKQNEKIEDILSSYPERPEF